MLLMLALAGCSTRLDIDPAVTGSIAAPDEPAAPASVTAPPTDDWEAVRQKVVTATPPAKAAPKPAPKVAGAKAVVTPPPAAALIAWENAGSGNSGTISDVIASTSKGRACRNFATTLASVDGVRAYRGEVCRKGGAWEYTRLEPLDRADEVAPKS